MEAGGPLEGISKALEPGVGARRYSSGRPLSRPQSLSEAGIKNLAGSQRGTA